MRRKLFLASVLTALLPFSANADVTLHLNNNVELLAYNGQTHSSPVFGSEDPVVLEDGTQQLAFRYVKSFEEGKDVSFVSTDVIIVKFDAADTDVFFQFPEHKNRREVRKFNEKPEFSIVNGDNAAIAFEQNKLLKSGFQLSRDYLSEIQRFNQTDAPASLRLTDVSVAEKPAERAATPGRTKVVVSDDALNEAEYQLHYWYEKADEETKARFKAFVNKR